MTRPAWAFPPFVRASRASIFKTLQSYTDGLDLLRPRTVPRGICPDFVTFYTSPDMAMQNRATTQNRSQNRFYGSLPSGPSYNNSTNSVE